MSRFVQFITNMALNCLVRYVRIPVWTCVVIVVLLLVIKYEIGQLNDEVLFLGKQRTAVRHNTFYSKEDTVKHNAVLSKEDQARYRREEVKARIDEVLADNPVVDLRVDNPVVDQHVDNPVKDQHVDNPVKDQHVDNLVKYQHADKPVSSERIAKGLVQRPAPPDPHVKGTDTNGPSDKEVEDFTHILETRIAQASGGIIGIRNCSTLAAVNNTRGTCIDTTCPHHFHPSARTRIRQLLSPRFRPTPQQLELVNNIAKDVAPKKYFFVTAISSNHYLESQALVFNMRQYIFNKLSPGSYSFLYFDLGLKPLERKRVEKNCNCTVLSMNLKAFPPHTWKLMCYAWKPFIIKALLPKTEVLVYMDASIRFRDMDLNLFFQTARQWGAQFLASMDSIPNHTVQSTFDFYEEASCTFWPFPELLAGFSVFHNEPFMTQVVLDPWVSCAFNVSCMCPVDPHAFRNCPHKERRVGQCHRFDLSSLTIQMAKLYGNKFGHLVIRTNRPPKVHRDERMDFFVD